MSADFTDFERAVLEWFQRHYAQPALSNQLASARFVRRDWTGHGVYIYFAMSPQLPPLDLHVFGDSWPIEGPQLRSSAIDHGGGALLWGKAGFADCIEMYAYGDYFREQVSDFELL